MISRFFASRQLRRCLCFVLAFLTLAFALSPALFQPAEAVAVAGDCCLYCSHIRTKTPPIPAARYWGHIIPLCPSEGFVLLIPIVCYNCRSLSSGFRAITQYQSSSSVYAPHCAGTRRISISVYPMLRSSSSSGC